MSGKFLRSVLVASILGVAGYASAQQQDNGGNPPPPPPPGQNGAPGGQGGRFGRGNFDPAQFRQQMEDRIKERLGAKDDEWQAIQPRLEKVMTLSMQSRMSGRSMFAGRSRGGDNGGDQQRQRPSFGGDSAVSRAQQDLQSTLDNPNASADEIAGRLKALRDAKEQSKQELTKAQSDLKELLTARQEAVLVSMGLLE